MHDQVIPAKAPQTHPPLVVGRGPEPEVMVNEQPYLQPRRTRASKPKVKTGCLTCRIRRVKCDETKPHCNRCTKFGAQCDGYKRNPPVRPAPNRLIRKRIDSPKYVILRMDSWPGFGDDIELRYFRVFCERFSSEIAGPFTHTLWKQLIPQASDLEPYLRHAMVAVGALSASRNISDPSSFMHMPNREGEPQLSEEHAYALRQYDRALNGIRKATERGEQQLRHSLLACLLVFCFETLQGRQGPAARLINSGLVLYNEWRSEKDHSISSQKRLLLEDELTQAFVSLDIQALLFLDNRPLDAQEQLLDETNELLKFMPSKFSELREARTFWQLIMKRNFHFKAKAQLLGRAAELGGDKDEIEWTETADFPKGVVPFSKLKEPSAQIQEECRKYIEDIQIWSEATSELFDSIPVDDQASKLVAALLKIQVQMNIVTLAGMTFTSETRFDAFLAEFREIVNLSASIHSQIISSPYRFDIGMIPALYLVGSRCRDKKVRGQAIELLASTPWREGIWDSGAVSAIAKWIRKLEEEGGKPGDDYIPEYRRAFLTSGNIDLYNRKGQFYCTQRRGPNEKDLVFKQALIRW